jgi:hypothetical protein
VVVYRRDGAAHACGCRERVGEGSQVAGSDRDEWG